MRRSAKSNGDVGAPRMAELTAWASACAANSPNGALGMERMGPPIARTPSRAAGRRQSLAPTQSRTHHGPLVWLGRGRRWRPSRGARQSAPWPYSPVRLNWPCSPIAKHTSIATSAAGRAARARAPLVRAGKAPNIIVPFKSFCALLNPVVARRHIQAACRALRLIASSLRLP
jgi:hypothetical protein